MNISFSSTMYIRRIRFLFPILILLLLQHIAVVVLAVSTVPKKGETLLPIAEQEANRKISHDVLRYRDPILHLPFPSQYASVLRHLAKKPPTSSSASTPSDSTTPSSASSSNDASTIPAPKILDGSKTEDRNKMAKVIGFCAHLFYTAGVQPPCVAECHPTVDCGLEAYLLCKPSYGDYGKFSACSEEEQMFCHKHGSYRNSHFPLPPPDMHLKRRLASLEYCASIFQMRGVRLSCFRSCSLRYWRLRSPDALREYKARRRVRMAREGRRFDFHEDPLGYSGRGDPWGGCTAAAALECQSLSTIKTHIDYNTCFQREQRNCFTTYSTSKISH